MKQVDTYLIKKSLLLDSSNTEQISDIVDMVAAFFCDDVTKTTSWFHAVNPMLGDIRPVDMIRLARQDRLQNFVESAMSASNVRTLL